MKKVIYIFIFFFGITPVVLGQNNDELIQKAYLLYSRDKEYEGALNVIEEVVQNRKGSQNPLAWHIRGFICKDIYADTERNKFNSNARDEAVKSFITSIQLDEKNEFRETNQKALNYLAKSYWNNASDMIEQREKAQVDGALRLFNSFREIYEIIYPDSALVDKEIQVNLALATAHRKIYEADRKENKEHWSKSNNYLRNVLELDPLNWEANYSLGVSYYNQGAFNLERLPDIEAIVDIYKVQGESMQSIQGALSFMLKAYEIDSARIESIKGLKWITFNLHQYDESEKYNQQLENQRHK